MGNKGERGRERGMEARDRGMGERTGVHMRVVIQSSVLESKTKLKLDWK